MTHEKAVAYLKGKKQLNAYYVAGYDDSESSKAIDMAIEALEKQIPKKPIHIHEEFDKHDWHKNKDGTVDKCAFEYEYHIGVVCKRCGESVCVLCHEDYDEYAGKCVIDKDNCPACGKRVSSIDKCCRRCGQALDWGSETNEQGE